MKNIYCIGECALDIVFGADGNPVGSMPGGRIVNAAAILARQDVPVAVVSEASAGPVGDKIVDWLKEAGCKTGGIDRITEGLTPTLLYLPAADGKMTVTRYESYPDDCFDVVWPRIGEGDVVVFGGYYAIDPRMRRRMSQLLQYASERGAVMVYLPGFLPSQAPRITKVMPVIYENLELADVVITRTADLLTIFGDLDAKRVYADHIDFYTHSLINVDAGSRSVTYYSNHEPVEIMVKRDVASSMMWNAGIVAGVAAAAATDDVQELRERGTRPATVFGNPPKELRESMLRYAVEIADDALSTLTELWQIQH